MLKILICLIILLSSVKVEAREVSSYLDLQFENTIRQSSTFSCGLASLATLLSQFYGVEVSEEELIKQYLSEVIGDDPAVIKEMIEDQQGVNLLQLKEIVEEIGFRAVGYRAEWQDLKNFLAQVRLPVIVHTQLALYGSQEIGHFSLALGNQLGRIIIKDPIFGKITYEQDYFLANWSGYFFLVLPPIDKLELKTQAKKELEKTVKEAEKDIERLKYYEKIYR